jgi:hypothetical protein
MLADLVELARRVDTHKHPPPPRSWPPPPGRCSPAVGIGRPAARPARVGDPSPGGDGAGLTRFLHTHAEQVVALDRPKRAARRHGAKPDPLDATRAARQALGRDQLAPPRAAGPRAALQAHLTTRRSAVQADTDAQPQPHALVVAAPDALRSRLRGLTTRQLITACGRLGHRAAWDPETAATAASLRALARRIQLLDAEIAEHTGAITTLVRAWRPDLLSRCGLAPSWPRSCCAPGPILAAAPATPPSPCSAGRPDPGLQRPDGQGAAESFRRTASSTRPCTWSS